jgi:hypothetical protein
VTGRAYPLFDIAQLILQKPERHLVEFSIKKGAEGKPVQPLFLCLLDDTLWLSEDEVVAHVLKKHFATFYQAERTATEPPKGKYTFVAQCGMSGAILGPPNHHDYQNQLRKLHAERFSRMPFEVYKSRVKIVRDEAVVKQWVDEQSWKTEYLCLNLPEPVKLANMEAVEKHFRETHKENIIKPVESHSLNGAAARALRSPGLSHLVRSVWEDQRHFPLSIATVLSQQFAVHGLQFFKVNKTITHVSVARPHYLDLNATPVSDGVKQIVQYIEVQSPPPGRSAGTFAAAAAVAGTGDACCRRPAGRETRRPAGARPTHAGTDGRYRRFALANPRRPRHRIRQRLPGDGEEARAQAAQAAAETRRANDRERCATGSRRGRRTCCASICRPSGAALSRRSCRLGTCPSHCGGSGRNRTRTGYAGWRCGTGEAGGSDSARCSGTAPTRNPPRCVCTASRR